MSVAKKELANDLAAYKRAAATLREKMAAATAVDAREILPVNGEIHVVLSGAPLRREQKDTLFGASAISFPIVKTPAKTPA